PDDELAHVRVVAAGGVSTQIRGEPLTPILDAVAARAPGRGRAPPRAPRAGRDRGRGGPAPRPGGPARPPTLGQAARDSLLVEFAVMNPSALSMLAAANLRRVPLPELPALLARLAEAGWSCEENRDGWTAVFRKEFTDRKSAEGAGEEIRQLMSDYLEP